MTSIVEINRTRLVNIYLAELVKKTGSMIAALKLPDGPMTTVQVDSDILNKALIKLFNCAVYRARRSGRSRNNDYLQRLCANKSRVYDRLWSRIYERLEILANEESL